MSSNTNFEVVILSEDEAKVAKLKSLLSKYYSLKIAPVCSSIAEAIEYINNHKTTIFFLDMVFSEVLFDIRKPPFIVGLCDTINTKKVKSFLKMGFFEIFYSPYSERELNSIMGKILNILGAYNKLDQQMMQRVEEENAVYAAEDRTVKSVFIMGTRNEESFRVVFDEVLYIEKVGNQVCVCFENGFKKYFRSNLKMFQLKFPKSQFQKINRSVVVNMDKVSGLIKNRVLIANNDKFEISRSFKKEFKAKLPR